MVPRLRRFLDVRAGEGLRVLLSFLYVALVVAAFLLAKPIRNSLFLERHGPYALVYVYAAVPLALSVFVPIYSAVAARLGMRLVSAGTLVFFSANALLFWHGFRAHAGQAAGRGSLGWLLPGLFFVWVNCFGVIAPVQAWSFASSLFDTRQARRLFGLVGAGASLGAITGGLLARFLVGPVGGTVNMLLVLAALILAAAGIVLFTPAGLRRGATPGGTRRTAHPFGESLALIARTPYLRLLAALVFLVAISTQWSAFQLSLVASARFAGRTDALTRFFGTFNVALGALTFVIQLVAVGPLLRRFGVGAAILFLPLALGTGSLAILLVPAFWPVLFTNAADQGLRFSLDKAAYELLYLPLPTGRRAAVKNAIDIVVSRAADAAGAVLLGCATRGFLVFRGFGLGLRGTAAVNLAIIAAWAAVAWRLRAGYVRTIQESIHRHRLDAERDVPAPDEAAVAALASALGSARAQEVRDALDAIDPAQLALVRAPLRRLLGHQDPAIRRRALSLFSAARDRSIDSEAMRLLRDPDPGVRTEALLFATREMGIDPLAQLERLGDFEDFSIRAGFAAFLASPGASRNLEAARLMLEAMAGSAGDGGRHDRRQAARVLGLVPDAFADLLLELLADPDPDVAREAAIAARGSMSASLVPALIEALADPGRAAHAADALAARGDAVVPELERRLHDPGAPLEIRRELPAVFVRIGTPLAQQALMDGLLQPDVTLRHRIVASLNKLRDVDSGVRLDRQLVELLLAAEIAGHYRSYQVLGPLRARLKEDAPILAALHQSMEQELERIFRLMALIFGGPGLHDAYVGLRSRSQTVRANALEFLDNVLPADLRRLLVPLLDSQVSVERRIELADRVVGARLETAERAVATLLASEDAWLRSCALHAVGALQLRGLEDDLRRLEASGDPAVREAAAAARQQLDGLPEPESAAAAPPDVSMGVG